ncbi:hypothetical protein HMPREF3291_07725 [Bacillus sp. HMSC76G11]|nr:hypothetical protein HMPREF3291_07725 [Bacillus sp. HMSC76G11]
MVSVLRNPLLRGELASRWRVVQYFEFALPYMMAIFFGIIGFSAVLYMAIVIQNKQKNKTN